MKCDSPIDRHDPGAAHRLRGPRGPRLKSLLTRASAACCALAVGLGLAGCGADTAGTVTLDFFQYKSEAAAWFTAKAREFEKTHQNIKVNVNNSSDADTDLRTRLVKNREPDVITVNGAITFGLLAEAGVFHDFTDDPIVDELNPGMVNIAKSLVQTTDPAKKRLYAIPYSGNASGYIINVDVWEAAGEDPYNPPTTWSEFIELLERFKSKGITPVEASTADPWTLQAPLSSLNSTLVPESEYVSLKDGSKTFDDLWTTVSDQLVEIYQNYVQANPAVTYQQATQDFAAGKAAILPLGTYAIPQVRLIDEDIKLRFAQMPATDDADEQLLTAGDDVMLTIGAHTKHYDEAREFVDFLMNDENVKDYSKAQSSFSPYKETYVGNDALEGVLDFYQAGRLTDFCDHYVPSSINIAGFLQTLITSGDTGRFLDSMQTEYDKIEARNFRK
ncbi:ABC transporter substrate-binding protein [Bifidobacterium samirii]|uniref:ABC transporter substrate-binding protein n=1 Tax=Bifidobacterium samirii TaxID=2306974 RepID=A0A430FIV7_9BIFI|nr:ABC transporter substrate-binding protein [Bifidobacterium samirii]RSX52712.1 ABC transporter substrate-binding protein [Bifidobacterium samirii]